MHIPLKSFINAFFVRALVPRVLVAFIFVGFGIGNSSHSAFASNATYGSEYNFSSRKINKAWAARMAAANNSDAGQYPQAAEQDAAKKMADYLKKTCGDCTITPHNGKWAEEYEVKFPTGFSFNISTDPACIEVQTFPSTSEKIASEEAQMQKYIFDAVKATGLHPEGNAHLNIGVRSAFETNPKAFARFLADYSNRAELTLGDLGEDPTNAPPLQNLSEKQQKAFAQLLEDVNSGKIKTIDEMASVMNYGVYSIDLPQGVSGSEARHYQAMGLKQLIKPDFKIHDMPFELRAIAQEKNSKEYTVLVDLMDKYIDHLKNRVDPIYYRMRKFPIALTKVEKAAGFVAFTRELGVDWKDYQSIVPEKYAKHLVEGQSLLEGAGVRKNVPEAVKSFNKVFTDRFHISPWMRNEVKRVMTMKTIDPEAFQSILDHLVKQSYDSQAHATKVSEFIDELSADPVFSKNAHFKDLLVAAQLKTAERAHVPFCSVLPYLQAFRPAQVQ